MERLTKLVTPPSVGDGITYAINGDSYPYTVVSVSGSGHRFEATPDNIRAHKNQDAYAEGPRRALFTSDPDGHRRTFTRRRDGSYQAKGAPYVFVYAGRQYKQDPCF